MDLGERLPFKSLRTWIMCSQCETTHTEEHSYRNNKTGEIWCNICLAKERKKRIEIYIRPELRI